MTVDPKKIQWEDEPAAPKIEWEDDPKKEAAPAKGVLPELSEWVKDLYHQSFDPFTYIGEHMDEKDYWTGEIGTRAPKTEVDPKGDSRVIPDTEAKPSLLKEVGTQAKKVAATGEVVAANVLGLDSDTYAKRAREYYGVDPYLNALTTTLPSLGGYAIDIGLENKIIAKGLPVLERAVRAGRLAPAMMKEAIAFGLASARRAVHAKQDPFKAFVEGGVQGALFGPFAQARIKGEATKPPKVTGIPRDPKVVAAEAAKDLDEEVATYGLETGAAEGGMPVIEEGKTSPPGLSVRIVDTNRPPEAANMGAEFETPEIARETKRIAEPGISLKSTPPSGEGVALAPGERPPRERVSPEQVPVVRPDITEKTIAEGAGSKPPSPADTRQLLDRTNQFLQRAERKQPVSLTDAVREVGGIKADTLPAMTPKSTMSEAGVVKPQGIPLKQAYNLLRARGMNVGKNPNEFMKLLAQDVAAGNSGARYTGRVGFTPEGVPERFGLQDYSEAEAKAAGSPEPRTVLPPQGTQGELPGMPAKSVGAASADPLKPTEAKTIHEAAALFKDKPAQAHEAFTNSIVDMGGDSQAASETADALVQKTTKGAEVTPEVAVAEYAKRGNVSGPTEEDYPEKGGYTLEPTISKDGMTTTFELKVPKGEPKFGAVRRFFQNTSNSADYFPDGTPRNPSFHKVWISADRADVQLKDEAIRRHKLLDRPLDFMIGKKKWAKVYQAWREAETIGRPLSDQELSSRGVVGRLREFYDDFRGELESEAKKRISEGKRVQRTDTYVPRISVGRYRVLKNGAFESQYSDLKEAQNHVESNLRKFPSQNYTIEENIMPDADVAAILGRGDARRMAKNINQIVESVPEKYLKREGYVIKGRFFGSDLPREADYMGNVTDPKKLARIYMQGAARQRILDTFNKEVVPTVLQTDSGNKHLVAAMDNLVGFMNGRKTPDAEVFDSLFSKAPAVGKMFSTTGRLARKYFAWAKMGFSPHIVPVIMADGINRIVPLAGPVNATRALGDIMGFGWFGPEWNPELHATMLKALGEDSLAGQVKNRSFLSDTFLHPMGFFHSAKGIQAAESFLAFTRKAEKLGLKGAEAEEYATTKTRTTAIVPRAMDRAPFFKGPWFSTAQNMRSWALGYGNFLMGLSPSQAGLHALSVLATTGPAGIPIIGTALWARKIAIDHPKWMSGLSGFLGHPFQTAAHQFLPDSVESLLVGGSGQMYVEGAKALLRKDNRLKSVVTPVAPRNLIRLLDEMETGISKDEYGRKIASIDKFEALLHAANFPGSAIAQAENVRAAVELENKQKIQKQREMKRNYENKHVVPKAGDLAKYFPSVDAFLASVQRDRENAKMDKSQRAIRKLPKQMQPEYQRMIREGQREISGD